MIERGCLVGDGVVLGKNARLGPFERVSRRKGDVVNATEGLATEEDEDSEDEWEEVEKRERRLLGAACVSLHYVLTLDNPMKIRKTLPPSWVKVQMALYGRKALRRTMRTQTKSNASTTRDSCA